MQQLEAVDHVFLFQPVDNSDYFRGVQAEQAPVAPGFRPVPSRF